MIALEAGAIVAERNIHITRETLVRYAGASGDFNPIHYRDDIATAAGLPGVIAHGMLTMGLAVSVLTDALGDPTRVVEYGCRFARPVIVDADNGVVLTVRATVRDVAETTATVVLAVSVGDTQVLVKANATVML